MNLNLLILAAGEGTRMKSSISKVMHPVLGKPMLSYVLETARTISPSKTAVVIGRGSDIVKKLIENYGFKAILQRERRGTGHAVSMAEDTFGKLEEPLVVVYGDNPFLQPQTIKKLVDEFNKNKASASVLTIEPEDLHGYGRIIRNKTGGIEAIVEEKDCSFSQKSIKEVNAGSYCFAAKELFGALKEVKSHNKQNEFYLTDVIGIMVNKGLKVVPVKISEEWQIIGVDSRKKLAFANRILKQKINDKWMEEGVTIIDPETTWIESAVTIGKDTVILPGTFLKGNTIIGEFCQLGPNCVLEDTTVERNSKIEFAVIKESHIGENAKIGPFCYIRNETVVENGVKIGTFVEMKKSRVGKNSKVPHLSYIGDAEIGENVNIGAGSITCNYDGTKKNKTYVGDNAFIGSDTLFIAPVKVGKGAVTGAGSVVRKDVENNEVVVGMPARRIRKKKTKEDNVSS